MQDAPRGGGPVTMLSEDAGLHVVLGNHAAREHAEGLYGPWLR